MGIASLALASYLSPQEVVTGPTVATVLAMICCNDQAPADGRQIMEAMCITQFGQGLLCMKAQGRNLYQMISIPSSAVSDAVYKTREMKLCHLCGI